MSTIMNAITTYENHFNTKRAAAAAVGITTEMMRIHRLRGYVKTRDLALRMEAACGRKVKAAALLGLSAKASDTGVKACA